MTHGTYWDRYRFPETVPGHEKRTFGVEDLKSDWEVYDANGDRIGLVRDIGDFLVVNRGFLRRDLQIPWSAVRLVVTRRIDLNLDLEEAKFRGYL